MLNVSVRVRLRGVLTIIIDGLAPIVRNTARWHVICCMTDAWYAASAKRWNGGEHRMIGPVLEHEQSQTSDEAADCPVKFRIVNLMGGSRKRDPAKLGFGSVVILCETAFGFTGYVGGSILWQDAEKTVGVVVEVQDRVRNAVFWMDEKEEQQVQARYKRKDIGHQGTSSSLSTPS